MVHQTCVLLVGLGLEGQCELQRTTCPCTSTLNQQPHLDPPPFCKSRAICNLHCNAG